MSRSLQVLGTTFLLLHVLAAQCSAQTPPGPPVPPTAQNTRPIIGVLTQPVSESFSQQRLGGLAQSSRVFLNQLPTPPTDSSVSYLSAAYVKWLESGGARVAVVPYNADVNELKSLFSSLNGILFTGGGLSLNASTTYFQTALQLWNWALEANAHGDFFPIWGTCQGFQLVSILAAYNHSVLEHYAFDSENLPLALNFTAAASSSLMFGLAPPNVYHSFATSNITINLHHDGVTPDTFAGNSNLHSFFSVLSTNLDREGKAFVSSIEGKHTPVYATQFHPERNEYEWDKVEEVPHYVAAVEAMQYLSRFFVNQTTYNLHNFTDPTLEANSLIYNYQVTFTGNDDSPDVQDEQTYYFAGVPAL